MSTNILQWDVAQANIEDDAAYLADAARSRGSVVASDFPSATANKLFFNLSTFCAAFSQALATKGYVISDSDISTLAGVLANVLTQADCPLAIVLGGTGASSFAAAGLVTFSELENSPNTIAGVTSDPSTSSTSPALLAEMTYTGTFSGRKVLLIFNTMFNCSTTGGNVYFQFYKDGSPIGPLSLFSSPTGFQNETASFSWVDLPTAASHTYSVEWYVTGGTTAVAYGTARVLQVTEI